MPDTPLISYLFERGLFPALGVLVLLTMWWAGVFRRGYLASGPRRRLRLPAMAWWVLLVLALASPWLGSLLGFVLFGVLVAAWPRAAQTMGLVGNGAWAAAGWGLLLGLPAVLLAMGVSMAVANLGLLLGHVPDPVQHELLKQLVDDPTPAHIARVALLAVVVAPLLEEAAYRGLIQTLLGDRLGRRFRWGIVLGVAVFFALAHQSVVGWSAMPGLLVLGVVFGAAYERTGSLWTPVAAHAVFNAANIAIALTLIER